MWKYKITEIIKPGLNRITMRFALTRDAIEYVTDEVSFDDQDVAGKTAAEMLAFAQAKIKECCDRYIGASVVATGLEKFIGNEFTL